MDQSTHLMTTTATTSAAVTCDKMQPSIFSPRMISNEGTIRQLSKKKNVLGVLIKESTLKRKMKLDRNYKTTSTKAISMFVIAYCLCISSPVPIIRTASNVVAAWALYSSTSNRRSSQLLQPNSIITTRCYVANKKGSQSSPCFAYRSKVSKLSATVESNRNMVSSSFYDDNNDDDEEEIDDYMTIRQQDITDDDENFNDLNNAAIEHTQQQQQQVELNSRKVLVNGSTNRGVNINSNSNNMVSSSSSRGKSRNSSSNNANKNTAFHDPQFLRKRTADLLKVTESGFVVGSSAGRDTIESIDTTVPTIPQLGRHMKVEKKTFHFLLDAWAFSGENDAAEQAMALLQRMEVLGQRSGISTTLTMNPIQPDVRSYTKAINAIARQGSKTAGEDAEQILEKMRTMYVEASHMNPEYAAAIKPNTYTYTAVIQAYTSSGASGSPERAEALIERMIDKYQRGDDSVRPNAKTFNAVIYAYGKAGNAERAARVFQRMEGLYESGVTEAKPNAINYNSLISAWANCDLPDSAQRAEAVLDRMEQLYKTGDISLQPTTVSFNAVIDAYAKSGEENAAQKAEVLLRHMYDLYESGNVKAKPNTRSFNSVMNAWAKSRDPNAASNAAELLELMEEKYSEGDTEVRPDVHSFCTVINAYARSGLFDKAERAFNLYHDMKEMYVGGNPHARPNVVAANAVLNACAFTTTGDDIRLQNRAVEIAHSILKELERSPNIYGKPDQVTYGTFMKTCANQMPDSHTRQQIVEMLFKKCAKDGLVGNLVLQQLRGMASEELYERLIGRSIHDISIRYEDLPSSWTCNVVEGKWRRRS